jgi:hypothetical protein
LRQWYKLSAMNSILSAVPVSIERARTVDGLLPVKASVVAGLAALALYLFTPTANYYWDGLAFALRVERVANHAHNANPLFHQNHLIYNAIVYLLYVVSSTLGFSVRALTVMQIASALSCALGIGFFFLIAQRISGNLYVAIVGAAALAVSSCWWKAATDADAYSLSVALVLICASTLLSEAPRWYLAGAALAGAMLIHELASLFYPVAMVSVLFSNRIETRLRFAIKLTLLAWGLTIASYYACAAFVFGITRPLDVIKWAGSNPYGVPFSNPLQTVATFPKDQIDVIFGHSFKAFQLYGGAVESSFAIIGVVALCVSGLMIARRSSFKEFMKSIWGVAPGYRDHWRRTLPVLVTWIALYALFLLVWEPYVLLYRVYYAPAVVLIVVLVLSNFHHRTSSAQSGAAAFAVGALFSLNLALFIAPYMRSNSNSLVAAAKNANNKWNEHTVIYFNGSSPIDNAFRYFNQTAEWRGASPARIMTLDDEIQRVYDQGGTVWLNDIAAKSVDPEWLSERARGEEIDVKLGDEFYRFVQLLPGRTRASTTLRGLAYYPEAPTSDTGNRMQYAPVGEESRFQMADIT